MQTDRVKHIRSLGPGDTFFLCNKVALRDREIKRNSYSRRVLSWCCSVPNSHLTYAHVSLQYDPFRDHKIMYSDNTEGTLIFLLAGTPAPRTATMHMHWRDRARFPLRARARDGSYNDRKWPNFVHPIPLCHCANSTRIILVKAQLLCCTVSSRRQYFQGIPTAMFVRCRLRHRRLFSPPLTQESSP